LGWRVFSFGFFLALAFYVCYSVGASELERLDSELYLQQEACSSGLDSCNYQDNDDVSLNPDDSADGHIQSSPNDYPDPASHEQCHPNTTEGSAAYCDSYHHESENSSTPVSYIVPSSSTATGTVTVASPVGSNTVNHCNNNIIPTSVDQICPSIAPDRGPGSPPSRWINATAMVLAAIVGGFLGAKIHYSIAYDRTLGHPGLMWQGGSIGGAFLVLFYVWVFKHIDRLHSVWHVADALAPLVPLGHAFGKLGCFFSGDGCYGPRTHLPWGMSFPNGGMPTIHPVHPTPLYETALGFFVFFYLWNRRRKDIGFVGRITYLDNPVFGSGDQTTQMMLLHASCRFLIEFVRDHNHDGVVLLGMRNPQMKAAVLTIICASFLRLRHLFTRPMVEVIAKVVCRSLRDVVSKGPRQFLATVKSISKLPNHIWTEYCYKEIMSNSDARVKSAASLRSKLAAQKRGMKD